MEFDFFIRYAFFILVKGLNFAIWSCQSDMLTAFFIARLNLNYPFLIYLILFSCAKLEKN